MDNISTQFYNCVVYAIINTRLKKIYYGSTIQNLSKRIQHHKKPSNKLNTRLLFQDEEDKNIIIKVLLKDNFKTIKDLHIQEKLYIKNHSASKYNVFNCINNVIPARGKREYYLDNRDKIKEKNREWAKNNRDKVNLWARNNYSKNKEKILQKKECECGAQICGKVLKRHYNSFKHQLYLKTQELEKLKNQIEN